MKKPYEKPAATEIEVAPNQAIAACSYKTTDFDARFVGYGVRWDGCRNMNGYLGELPQTMEEAKKVAKEKRHENSEIDACYDVYYGGTFLLSWEDYNANGVWEGDGIDHWQNVMNTSISDAIFSS